MSDFDPTDPWGQKSPWDVAQPENNNTTAPEAPVSNPSVAANPNPFKIGFTLKAAAGYEAEWLTPTVYGSSAQETAERGKELLLAMKSVGLIEFTAQAAEFTRGQFMGAGGPKSAPAPVAAAQPSFNPASGQVQFGGQAPAAAPASDRPAGVPAHFTYKEGNKNGKTWKGWFPPRGSDEKPIWI
ncbi:hypothetical protein [Streptomyces sp. WG5]|uniref:hypothetical protein n=1 Tax=Streptomyces sp. WG5 TaxID=3417648 RepID=UPI003CF46820